MPFFPAAFKTLADYNPNHRRHATLKLQLLGFMLIWALLLFALPALAQGGYPTQADRYLNDFAGVLSSEQSRQLRTMLEQFDQAHQIQMVVVTINSTQDYPVDQPSWEAFATSLFNTWGIGDSQTNKGVMILLAVADRKVRIELGKGYGRQYDSDMQGVINEFMLPAFKQQEYGRGLYQGARATIGELTGEWPAEAEGFDSSESSFSLMRVGGVAAAGVLGLVGFSLRGLWLYLRWRCPTCGKTMSRVKKINYADYLNPGQLLEHRSGSARYEVRHCTRCKTHKAHSRPVLFSTRKKCPECGYRTVETDSTTLQPATYDSAGLKQITDQCGHCTYSYIYTATIPQLVETSSYSSSSSSDFSSSSSYDSSSSSSYDSGSSGGSSDGGGASGSW